MSTRRFYFELVGWRRRGAALRPLPALARPALLDELGRAAELAARGGTALRVAPLVELGPHLAEDLAVLREVREALGAAGVGLDLWLQLPDDATRFLNGHTAEAFTSRIGPVLAALTAAPGVGLCLDVEPSVPFLDATWVLGRPREHLAAVPGAVGRAVVYAARSARHARRGALALADLDERVRAAGLPVHVAVLPALTPDAERAARLKGRFLGCPLEGDGGRPLLGTPAPMAYVTLLRRLLGRVDRVRERATLQAWAERHAAWMARRRAGPLGLALGQIGTGVMEHEPVYEDAAELADDVALVVGQGFTDLSFFCLEGLVFGPRGLPPDEDMRPTREGREAWWQATLLAGGG